MTIFNPPRLIVTLLCLLGVLGCSVEPKFVGSWRANHNGEIAQLEIRSDGVVLIDWRRSKSSAVWQINDERQLAVYASIPTQEDDQPMLVGKIINYRLVTTGKLSSEKTESLTWLRLPEPGDSHDYFMK